MTAPTNARQTSDRERLADDLDRFGHSSTDCDAAVWQAAAQLRADEAEIAQLRTDMEQLRVDLARERLNHTETSANLAAADEQANASDEIISALRAENEALRTVVESKFPLTDEDVKQIMDEFVKRINIADARRILRRGAKFALQSFIRSKESRRE